MPDRSASCSRSWSAPRRGSPCAPRGAEELARAERRRSTAATLRNRGGEPVRAAITKALVREDGKVLYPVDDGIPVMLIEESIEL